MRKFYISILILLLLPVSAYALTVDQIQSAYKGLKDIKGVFIQKSYLKDLGSEQTFAGDFAIKFPNKMRYLYKSGSQDEIIINNDRIIIYQKKEKQVLKGPFDRNTYGAAPVSLLSGLGDVKKEFNAEEKGGRLLLKPKSPMGGIKSIELEGAGDAAFPIKSFRITDVHSNVIRITLKDVKENTGLKDRLFEFTPPPGVGVFENP